jgi:hypothetical protein
MSEETTVIALQDIQGFDSPEHFREVQQEVEDAATQGELTRGTRHATVRQRLHKQRLGREVVHDRLR